MDGSVDICCGVCAEENFSDIIKIISPDAIDNIYTKEIGSGDRKRYYISVKSKNNLLQNGFLDCLSEWIITNFEHRIMCEIMRLNFTSITSEDIRIIVKETEKHIDIKMHKENNKIISIQLHDYLSQNDVLNIDGFIRFRLNEYREKLEKLLYLTIDNYLAEKEYEAFIDMLRAYIEMQYPMTDLLHIKENADGSYALYDFKKNNISLMCEEILNENISIDMFEMEDKLISILLTLIPKRIIWHSCCGDEINFQSNILKTIKAIFNNRISVCEGCEFCKL